MIIYLIQYYSTANNRLSRFNRCQRDPTNAMEIHILTCKQKVANFGRNGHLGLKHVFTITPMTVQTTFLYSIIIANGQGRGSKGNINGIPEPRFQLHNHFPGDRWSYVPIDERHRKA